MAAGRVLLDTNIAIPLLAKDAVILRRLEAPIEVFVPSIVIGELYYGAFHSARATENARKISEFALSMKVLGCDMHSARLYGEIKAALRSIGMPIPENDLWIAAVARQHELTLVTRDAHFAKVPSLSVEDWSVESPGGT